MFGEKTRQFGPLAKQVAQIAAFFRRTFPSFIFLDNSQGNWHNR
jgi:hypothetical protein